MSQTLSIERDVEGRTTRLSGSFEQATNGNGSEDHFHPEPVDIIVPPGYAALVSAELTVDDWGVLDIESNGETQRVIDLTSDTESPGPRGGHVRWTGTTSEPVLLKAGTHTITVRQNNQPYNENYAHAAQYNVSYCHVDVRLEYKRINLMTRSQAQDWLDAYEPVNYINMNTSSHVYDYVGGELKTLRDSGDESYDNSCALRVSVALTTLGLDYTSAASMGPFNNVSHLYQRYALLSVADVEKFLKSLLGDATYETRESYEEDREDGDIIVFGGKTDYGEGDAHSGICTGETPQIAGPYGLGNLIWVLNRPSWLEPDERA